LSNNYAEGLYDEGSSGGAIECAQGCAANVVDTVFDNNTTIGDGDPSAADSYATGGAVDVDTSSATFTGCRFVGNTSPGAGAAISYEGGTTGAGTISNCTFFGNSARGNGGAVYKQDGSTTTFTNSIFWSNTAGGSGPHVYITGTNTATVVRSSDVGGSGFDGTNGNIDADPMFVSTSGTVDVHLKPGSPCIDKGGTADLAPDMLDLDGDGNVTEPLPFDLDGLPRVEGANVDMGATEWVP